MRQTWFYWCPGGGRVTSEELEGVRQQAREAGYDEVLVCGGDLPPWEMIYEGEDPGE